MLVHLKENVRLKVLSKEIKTIKIKKSPNLPYKFVLSLKNMIITFEEYGIDITNKKYILIQTIRIMAYSEYK